MTADIITALMARVAALNTGTPGLPIAWPEQAETFVPPSDGRYLAVAWFGNAPAWEGVSDGRVDQGILLISVVWPKNGGIIAPAIIADLIIAHFPKALPLSSGAARVKISKQPWAAQPLIEDSQVQIPVTISWTA